MIEVPDFLPPKIQNWPSVTVIVIEHPQASTCVCGCTFVPVVAAILQMKIGSAEVQQQSPSGIVIPGKC